MAWLTLLHKHSVPAELIYVEWNPYVDASQYQASAERLKSQRQTPFKNIQLEAIAYQSFDSSQSSDDVEESREDFNAGAPASVPSASTPQPAPEFVRLADFFERCVLLCAGRTNP